MPGATAEDARNLNAQIGGRPGGWRMIRSELIQKIADENPHLTLRHVERIVNTVFDEIIDALAKGERVELRGFGAFSVKSREARIGAEPAHRRLGRGGRKCRSLRPANCCRTG